MKRIAWVLVLGWAGAAAAGQTAELHVGPYLQQVGASGATVMWETTEAVVGTVEFGLPGARRQQRRHEDESRTIHEIRIDALQPNTRYTYRILWADSVAGPFEFCTAPPAGSYRTVDGVRRIRIAAYGDSRSRPDVHRHIVDVIARFKPDLILHCGDLVAQGARYEQWKPQFFDPLAPLLPSTPLFTILGNHEQNSPYYYEFFSLPNNEAWWSADFGPVHLVGLDSSRFTQPDSEQTHWLEHDLQRTQPRQWVVAFLHHPLFSAHPTRAVNGDRWSWQPLFQKYGVDLVLSGHDHHYQRTYPVGPLSAKDGQPVLHLTTGGGGAPLYPVHEYPWTALAQRQYNVAIIDLYPDRMHGQVYSDAGEPIDAFVFAKDAPVPAERFAAYDAVLWQHRLAESFNRLQPRSVAEGAFELPYHWELDSTFAVDVQLQAAWQLGPGWKCDAQPAAQLLNVGGKLALAGRLQARWPHCYPPPKLRLTVTDTTGNRLFRNDRVELEPLRVWPRREAVAAARTAPPEIDGKPDDWSDGAQLTHFVDTGGRQLAAERTYVQLARDDEHLYVLARMDDPGSMEAAAATDDDLNVLQRDEAFQVNVATAQHVYTFAVNAASARYDARDTDRTYNAPFRAAVTKQEKCWLAELAIPLASLQGAPQRINFGRTVGPGRAHSEWVPTFGQPYEQRWYGYLQDKPTDAAP